MLWRIKTEVLNPDGTVRGTFSDQWSRTRKNATKRFYSEVYGEIKADAGLDTAWGNRLAVKASRICDDIEAGKNVNGGSVGRDHWRVAIGREG